MFRLPIFLLLTVPVQLVQAILLSHVGNAAPPLLVAHERFQNHPEVADELLGQLLVGELSCANCHPSQTVVARGGPSLLRTGIGLQSSWVEDFLLAPQTVKPGTTMPDLLQALPPADRRQAASALSVFLSTQQKPFTTIQATGANPVPHQFWKQGQVDEGDRLYHRLGCVACHAPAMDTLPAVAASGIDLAELLEEYSPDELQEMGLGQIEPPFAAVPLLRLDTKYTAEGLARFLINPLESRPGGRMPHFGLKVIEAAHLAAYLQARFASVDGDAKPDTVGRAAEVQPAKETVKSGGASEKLTLIDVGKAWFVKLRCNACHQVDAELPEISVLGEPPPLSQLPKSADGSGSCCSTDQASASRFQLTSTQWSHLWAFLPELDQGDHLDRSPQAAATLSLLSQNCYACHVRGELGGVARDRSGAFQTVNNIDLGDEGRLPPSLTAVGSKLKTSHLERVLAGKAPRVRPHMHARMPSYPTDFAKQMAAVLSAADQPIRREQVQHAQSAGWPDSIKSAAESLQAGRTLMDLGCVQCHAFAGQSMPGVTGVDLAKVDGRLHPEWFYQFLLNPGAIKQNTRMPQFFPDGVSPHQDIFAGDVSRQIAAMWKYLSAVDNDLLPEKIQQARAADFELIPEDRPLLLRTFMPHAGHRAIAVGYPQRMHMAFDAQHCHPALLWKGRFLDAEGTWFIRFAPAATPLDQPFIKLAANYPLSIDLPARQQDRAAAARQQVVPRFSGFQIAADGVPHFESMFGDLKVTEHWTPAETGFRRMILIQPTQPEQSLGGVFVNLHVAPELIAVRHDLIQDHQGLTVRLLTPEKATEVFTQNSSKIWRLSEVIDFPTQQSTLSIELEYQW